MVRRTREMKIAGALYKMVLEIEGLIPEALAELKEMKEGRAVTEGPIVELVEAMMYAADGDEGRYFYD